jgi:DNA-directed RNA polymerase specialized sigma24 family protein
VERSEAVAQLPDTYQRVIGWLDEGHSHDEIATAMGIDPNAVGPLVSLATAKLARLVGGREP